jgi:predicted double-glycine peptidase
MQYGVEKTEKEFAQLCEVDANLGVTDVDIERVARSLGFSVTIKNESSMKEIAQWLEKGVPVIVDWFTRGRTDYDEDDVADGHYSVVTGLDDMHIYLQDPEVGRVRKIVREDFLRVWFDFSGEYITPDTLIIRQIIAIYR